LTRVRIVSPHRDCLDGAAEPGRNQPWPLKLAMRLNQTHSSRALRRAVITGIGVVAPNGCDVTTFWDSVRAGNSAAGLVSQFDPGDSDFCVAAEVKDTSWKRLIKPKYERRYDKTIKFGVAAAKLAIEDSRIDIDAVEPDRKGVVEGTTVSGLHTVFETHQKILKDGGSVVRPFSVVNGYCGEGSSVLALELGLHGHAITYCSGCCSSNDAIGYALNMVQMDEVDVMIAGGADANLSLPTWAGFSALRVMSNYSDNPAKAMRPFDRNRDGFVLGEGAAYLVIEELGHALNRKADIYAEVLGHGRSCEAFHLVDLHPDGIGAGRAMEKALRQSRLSPSQVDYINAHGTATQSNDPVETRAVKRLFGPAANRVAISSTKPVTGHLMGAAGALETAICALAIRHQTIPPTINLLEPDPECDLDYVPLEPRPYPVDVALNLSAGFGGKNSCLVLGQLNSSAL